MSSASHNDQEVPLFAGLLQIPSYGDLKMYNAMGARLHDPRSSGSGGAAIAGVGD